MAQCKEKVMRGYHFWPCGTPAQKGKDYCAGHDPERIKARRDAATAKWEAERAEQERLTTGARALCQSLGVGSPYFGSAARWAGGIILTQTEAASLVAQLEAANAR